MNWKSHALIGAVLVILVAFFIFKISDYLLLFEFFVFGALSALVPDLDHSSSKGRQLLDKAVVIGSLLIVGFLQNALFFALAIIAVYFILFTFFKPAHRGITHSLVACFVFSVLVCFSFNLNFAIAGLIGYFSHLLADKEIKLV